VCSSDLSKLMVDCFYKSALSASVFLKGGAFVIERYLGGCLCLRSPLVALWGYGLQS